NGRVCASRGPPRVKAINSGRRVSSVARRRGGKVARRQISSTTDKRRRQSGRGSTITSLNDYACKAVVAPRLNVSAAPAVRGSRSSWDLVPVSPTCFLSSQQPIPSGLLKADRLRAVVRDL